MESPFPPVLFEIINCVLWTFAAAVLVIVGRYLATHAWMYWSVRRVGLVEIWRTRDHMAVALLVTCAGEFGIRFWTWVGRYLVDTHGDTAWMTSARWGAVPVFFCVIEAWGWCCIARVLSPDAWGRWGWRACVLFSAAVLTATLLIR